MSKMSWKYIIIMIAWAIVSITAPALTSIYLNFDIAKDIIKCDPMYFLYRVFIGPVVMVIILAFFYVQFGPQAILSKVYQYNHWCVVLLYLGLILNTIWLGYEILTETTSPICPLEIKSLPIMVLLFGPIHLLCVIYQRGKSLQPYCLAILDIYDGIEMLATKLNSSIPVWVQITVLLAVITFYISSLLEVYYLRFPRSILSERAVRLGQLVSNCIFFLLYVLLLAYNPHEYVLVIKAIIRVCYHYKTFSDLHHHAPRQTRPILAYMHV